MNSKAVVGSSGAGATVRLDWTNSSFLLFAHLVAAFAVIYLAAIHFSWWTVGLGLLWTVLCGVSVTAGYHRLFAHRSYRASRPLQFFYLAFGAAAVQNSALKWAADHRVHHAHTDQDQDPYNARKGFWWSHIGWVLLRGQPVSVSGDRVPDLRGNGLLALQERYYVPLAVLMGAGVPAALGSLWGDPIGAVLVAGFLRLVVQWHATFCINSLTHRVGSQPYSTQNSARDSGWVALLTMGEGYHNFHHRFPVDYRNGVRWYHFDPTKWWLWGMGKIGLASSLRRVPVTRIAAVRAAVAARLGGTSP